MKAVIDGDVFAYQAACMGEGTADAIQMSDEVAVDVGNKGTALSALKSKLAAVMRLPKIDNIIVALSDDDNFRKDIHPGYKRERGEKPESYAHMVAYLRRAYVCHTLPGLEGDDVMGLLLTGKHAKEYVGFTTDKDLYTIPGNICRMGHDWVKGVYKPRHISIKGADRFWMTQTITGDTVDGYKGAPGAGPKAAKKALERCIGLRQMWDAALHVYADQFDHKRWGQQFNCPRAYDEALMNARCARILRTGDYDHKTGEVKLWLP